MTSPSKRFSPSRITSYFVPVALTLLSVGLLLVILAVIMVVAGLIPAN